MAGDCVTTAKPSWPTVPGMRLTEHEQEQLLIGHPAEVARRRRAAREVLPPVRILDPGRDRSEVRVAHAGDRPIRTGPGHPGID